MAKRQIAKASTSAILEIFIRDSSSTTGAGLTGLTNLSSGLTCYYHRNKDGAAVQVSLVSMTVGTFTSLGFKEVDSANMPGLYQLCLPDAAYATGSNSVSAVLKGATNMMPVALEIELTNFDVQTAVAQTGDSYPRIGAPVGASISADIAALPVAVWAATTRTLSSFGTLVADTATAIWGAAARTLTAFGFTVNTNANSTETAIKAKTDLISTGSVTVTSPVSQSGTLITVFRGTTLPILLNGLGSLVGRDKLYFTVKRSANDADADAIIQIEETAGLVRLNGAAGTSGDGSLVVNDATLGNITITIQAAASSQLPVTEKVQYNYYYDVKKIDAGDVDMPVKGRFRVEADVTRAIV